MSEPHILQTPQNLATCFRTILSSFSKPAVPVAIAHMPDAPIPLLPTTAALALTLFDYQTPFWLSPDLNTDEVRKFLRFHTGAPLTLNPREASFAIITTTETARGWPDFNLGNHEYPDRSTTVIVQVPSFAAGEMVTVSGPGLEHPVSLAVVDATPHFWQHIQNNNSLFPIGNDFIFASAEAIAALPRSSLVQLMEHA